MAWALALTEFDGASIRRADRFEDGVDHAMLLANSICLVGRQSKFDTWVMHAAVARFYPVKVRMHAPQERIALNTRPWQACRAVEAC